MQGRLLALVRGELTAPDGNLYGGKSIRYLQLGAESGLKIQYDIETMQFFDAELLDRHLPRADEAYSAQDRVILGRWIAQRFDRLALPSLVVDALKQSGVEGALMKQLARTHSQILDVRVLLIDGSPPTLSFLVVYDTGSVGAQLAAKQVAEAIEKCAETQSSRLDGLLVIDKATTMGDTDITMWLMNTTRPYRAEYLSLRASPPSKLPPR